MTFLKEDPTETVKTEICESLCKHWTNDKSQDELDECCDSCVLNKIKRIETV